MLEGINPLLTGELLLHLDRMGHSDAVVIADAHFPAWAIGARVIDLPGTTTPEVLAAVRSVVPLDDAPALDLMASADGEVLDVQRELAAAAGVDDPRYVDRFEYYELAKTAYVIVRTGETRTYGNALLRKGVVGYPAA
ncbi:MULTISPECIES: RbsD/FucU family protein [Microbacterium]|uniref:L-fucose mutarotase n=1 Tax=Microbacterium trichothecenolyticum TaxID=69370 RepID=A0A0M2HDM8_MICTR|nr:MULTISPECIES: RbsD/FucU domain-containing protein [Microbacterium]KJL42824.1 L-fucose mutarotase [Microbacterium trichothecenolyticum]MDR7187654.1 L-fucose mutarotase [Microbacterium sp. BE35]